MKSICMVTTSEIFHDTRIINEAATLAKKDEVTILARRYPGQKISKFPFKTKLISYLKMPLSQLNIFSSLLSLMKAAFKQNPDIYHAHDLDGLLCAFPAALLKGKILIYDSHELWSATFPFANLRGLQWLLPALEKALIWRVHSGITVNRSIADYLSKKYHKTFLSLYNYPMSTKTRKTYSLRKKFPNKKIILHLGSADEGRGLEQIIKAAQYLPNSFIVVFLGGGKTEKLIKNEVDKLRLKDKIFFLPAVLPEEIIETIKEADLGLALTQKISLSYYYSLPNKIFQYLASGLPILGSNFPEFKKVIIANSIGETVDPSKPKLIARKIQKISMSEKQAFYRRHLAHPSQRLYNWNIEAKKLIKFYQSII